MADDPEVDSLLTVPPDEFVAARNALAKSLRVAGRKDDAAAVAALRRPTVVDWALNCVASTSSKIVESAAGAAQRLRQAQEAVLREGGGGASDLREAMGEVRASAAELRGAAERVLRDAGRPSSDLGALSTRVNEVMVSDALLEQLRRGRLGTIDVDAADPFSGMPEVVAPQHAKKATKAKRSPTAAAPSAAASATASARTRDDAAQRRQRERERAEARKRVEVARRVVTRAERQVSDAGDRLAAAQEAADTAQADLDAARQSLGAAEQEVEALTADL
jgi:hypothetical protein